MAHAPPAFERRTYAELIGDCVHCGFCLPACPTYRSWGDEPDSPRGRIDLMKGLAEGTLDLNASVVGHLDACLGCMGCVTACPSGVRYDLLIEATRARVEREYERPPADRGFREFIFALLPYPGRLRVVGVLLALAKRTGLEPMLRRGGIMRALSPRLATLDALAPDTSPGEALARLPTFVPARGERRGRVALIAGCVQRVFFPNVNAATLRVLSAEGFDVEVPPAQGCCGALSLHAGRDGEARRLARALLPRFEAGRYDAVLVNAAGCGSTLKQYGELLAGDGTLGERAEAFAVEVRDVSEFLAAVEPRAPRRELPLRVAYHDACHLAHAQRIREQPRALLRTIPKLELLEIPEGEQCCGSAGVYNLLQPESATEIGERKVDNVLSLRADVLASANPGCSLQIRAVLARRGAELLAAHPIELLDAALA